MKRLLLVSLLLFVVSPLIAGPTVVFSDDFNDGVIDTSKWTLSEAGGRYPGTIGNSVTEAGGILRIGQDSTDSGGRIISAPITVNSTDIITISARLRVHNAGSYFSGETMMYNGEGGFLARYGHYNYHYNQTVVGFGNFYNGERVGPLWDQWFDEVVTYNPATGAITYTANGQTVSYTGNPLNSSTLKLDIDSYGWWTGHYTEFDYISVAQVPEPATMLLLGLGGVLLRKRKN
ncbi:MAG: PEP-CTERM sorting domain-containing protein [Anaerohalosphaera sp.]|nr:PEP-CTERM sorting domain-containing protein [Anaerohalosphaera sp.]